MTLIACFNSVLAENREEATVARPRQVSMHLRSAPTYDEVSVQLRNVNDENKQLKERIEQLKTELNFVKDDFANLKVTHDDTQRMLENVRKLNARLYEKFTKPERKQRVSYSQLFLP